MDIMMPEMDGLEALRIIRSEEKVMKIPAEYEAKVIMMTALDDPKSVMKSFYESGATSYIVKPVVRAKLRNELSKIGIVPK